MRGAGAGRLLIRFVGHATVLVAMDGVRLLTDPLLRRRVGPLRRVAPLDRDAARRVDAALVSHAHRDHLDPASLRRLGAGRVVVPRGAAPMLRRRRIGPVTEVAPGDRVAVGPVEVLATPADHGGSRGPLGPDALALGYAMLGSRRALFLGDTDLFPAMEGLVEDLDVLLVPIWGWGPTLGRGRHLDPARAAEAVRLLRPRVAIPIHWGTLLPAPLGLLRRPAFLSEPAEAFAAAVTRVAPEAEARILRPGEATTIG
ncbi:MBL fold metallo-hydrolase [Miltoncostaea marina]|uniref:MBL fold metallo-hydrolase n=1 Tax=Miltoncostaea marina TaxID=2843215 RepID=UPI001C3D2926|nr:MBL fold metallo-hydrolase [Miltoncostaea marina]